MTSAPPSLDDGYAIPQRYWGWLGTPRAVAALVWIAAIGSGVAFTHRALHWFDVPPHLAPERKRADGNAGHAQIDFGGQWLMGRMVATGHGRELYHRARQRQVLRDGYPVTDESLLQQREAADSTKLRSATQSDDDTEHDANNLMNWFMGQDAPEGGAGPAIGGPLYPPVHALFYAPLGLIDRPQRAYHFFQVFCALLVPVAGLGVKVLTRGRIWWSVATLGIYLFPGTRGALDLGQNPTISLCIVIWGWALASRGYYVAGGVVWGLFAFKPVWAAAFFLVPLLMRRWRFCGAMVLTGAAFGLLTLPVVGLESWFHWLKIGREAADLYKVNDNWIHLSRDLQGIPRRILHDFTQPQERRETPLANSLAWGLWGAVFAATAAVYLLRGDRSRPTGLSAGFLFLGAYLTCFHFMYYDVLLASAAVAVLLADPKRFLRAETFAVAPADPAPPSDRALPLPTLPKPLGARMLGYVNSFPLTVVVALFLMENSLSGMELEATVGIRYYATPATDGSTNASVPRVRADTGPRYPIDTFLLMTLWAWCGWRLIRGEVKFPTNGGQSESGVNSEHEEIHR